MKILTLTEFWDLVEEPDNPTYNQAVQGLVDKAARRGDYVLVYRNEDLGHPDLGHCQTLTYGSEVSFIEGDTFGLPPTTMPDVGGAINFRYQLVGLYAPGDVRPAELIEADIVRRYGKVDA